jgi:predicted aspartyl protease
MRRIGVLIALLALFVPASQAWATLPAEQPYRISHHGRLVTDVYINGQGPFAFLIDSASSRSLIFEHVRKQLGLTQSQPALLTVYGINDVANALPVRPAALRVAGEEIRNLTLGVLPDMESAGPDGVLGTDVLAHYFVVLDRGAMRIKFLPPGEDSAKGYADWAQASLVPRPLKNFPIQFWYLKTRFNDRTINALFDLGAGTTMMNWDAAERLGLRRHSFSGPPPLALQDVLGKRAPAVQLLDLDVRLSSRSWNKQTAIAADAPIFRYFDLEEQPAAIVGPGLLSNNSLAIDFAGQRLFIGPTLKENP